MKHMAFIFGAGGGGRRANRFYGERFDVLGFIDNNPRITGTRVDGLLVYLPDHLASQSFDKLLIASGRSYEIYDQLMDLGVDDRQIEFVPNDVMGGRYELPTRFLKQLAWFFSSIILLFAMCVWI